MKKKFEFEMFDFLFIRFGLVFSSIHLFIIFSVGLEPPQFDNEIVMVMFFFLSFFLSLNNKNKRRDYLTYIYTHTHTHSLLHIYIYLNNINKQNLILIEKNLKSFF